MSNPQLAKASDIEAWAQKIDSRSDFPELIRRLVLATADPIKSEFRAQEGTDYAGWDGRVQTKKETTFVPAGSSGWEMGVGKNPKTKVSDDYGKRTKDPDPFDPSEDSFVFCTPRRWAGKEDWVDRKRDEGEWKDVRVYDADDLATWLTHAPGVHLWFSLMIGKPVSEVEDLITWWMNWKDVTSPELTSNLLLSGRSGAREALITQLEEDKPTLISVKAESPEEALAFLAACVTASADTKSLAVRTIIVESKASWRYFSKHDLPLILVPKFRDQGLFRDAVGNGHFVVLPVGSEYRKQPALEVPRLNVMEARERLEKAGQTSPEARHLAGLLRRSLAAFRRVTSSVSPQEPDWASGDNGPRLLPLVLAGMWDQGSTGDQEIISELGERDYEELLRDLNRWRGNPEPPFRQVGSEWRVNAKEVAWRLLAPFADQSLLQRFEDLAVKVLTERDPQRELSDDEQLMPRPGQPQRSHSETLRQGIADTIGMLGVLGEIDGGPQPGDGANTDAYAGRIVRTLLTEALNDSELWLDLAPHLRQLAEAGPDRFLSILEEDLKGDEPAVVILFEGRPGLLSPNYPYPNLLWALRRLAWSPEYFTRVADILARLADIAPETKIANSPARTLHSFFRFWLPQCGASLSHRFDALDRIRKKSPGVAWNLMLGLLPTGHDSASIDSGPGFRGVLWREWANEAKKPTRQEWLNSVEKLSNRIVEDVEGNPDRWTSLIGDIHHLYPSARNTALGKLEKEIEESSDVDWKSALREKLRREINRHRSYPEADWSMDESLLDRLHGIVQGLESNDLKEENKWLFTDRPSLPVDAHSYRDELAKRRRKVLRVILDEEGEEGIIELAQQVSRPDEVGKEYASLDLDEPQTTSILKLLEGTGPTRKLSEGFVRSASRDKEWREKYISRENLADWDVSKRVAALLQLPSSEDLISLVEHFGEDTEQRFWRQNRGFLTGDSQLLQTAAKKWIRFSRPRYAIRQLAMASHQEDFAIDPEVVGHALDEGLKVDIDKDPSNMDPYDVNTLLTYLRQNESTKSSSVESLTTIEQLEWGYLPLIRSHMQRAQASDHYKADDGEKLLLHRRLSEDPAFFVEVVDLAFKRDSQKEVDTEEEIARRAHTLLNSWHQVPGYVSKEDSVDEDYLINWLSQVQKHLDEKDLVTGGHIIVGQMLRWGPVEKDGGWPAPAICEAIEFMSSKVVDRHFRTEIFTSRGVTSRGPYAGGAQERSLAEKYEQYAKRLEARWPRVASILRRLAKSYRADAERIDRRAERDQDNFGKG